MDEKRGSPSVGGPTDRHSTEPNADQQSSTISEKPSIVNEESGFSKIDTVVSDDRVVSVERRRRARRAQLATQTSKYGIIVAMIVVMVMFSLLRPESYPTIRNAETILGTNSVLLLLALGALIPLVVGEFDLSVGAMLNASSALLAALTGARLSSFHADLPPLLAVGIVLGVAGALGAFNGLLIVKVGISSFIATLGTATVLLGIILYLTGGTSLFLGVPQFVFRIGGGDWLGIPKVIPYAAVALVLVWYLLEHTPLGRRLYAVGASPEAATLSGIRVGRAKIFAFAASGIFAALAGILHFGRVGAAHPDIGPQFLLPALAACFLGATTIRPGRFNPLGTAVGVVFLAVGVAGLQQVGVPFWVEPFFNGSVLLVAVGLSRATIRLTT